MWINIYLPHLDGNPLCTSCTVEGCTVGMGGKSRLRATLAPLIPEQDKPLRERKLQRYVEVFGGAGWLLLYKPRWFSSEVYNDINEGLVNMFSVIRFHPDELTKELECLIHSQKLFDYYRGNLHLTDIQKAAATLVRYGLRCNLLLCGFAANRVVGSFSARGDHYSFDARISPKELIGRIASLRERFANVAISNESFERCIKRWDKENTFLYLDPPYVGAEDVYSDIGEFGVAQHIQLADILKESKATWMLSYGDNALVRELYKGFPIREAKVLYSGLGNAGESQHEANELIITNYEPVEPQGGLFLSPS